LISLDQEITPFFRGEIFTFDAGVPWWDLCQWPFKKLRRPAQGARRIVAVGIPTEVPKGHMATMATMATGPKETWEKKRMCSLYPERKNEDTKNAEYEIMFFQNTSRK